GRAATTARSPGTVATRRATAAPESGSRSAAAKPAHEAPSRRATTVASGTSYSGSVITAPTIAAPPRASTHVMRRSGDHRPNTAHPAAASVTMVGAASQGDTQGEDSAT